MREIKLQIADSVPESQINVKFLQGMIDRMSQGFFTYGPVADFYPEPKDAIANTETRINKYVEDGNLEWLMDAANFLLIEFMYPRHPKAHFRATSREESPGTWEGDLR